MRQRFLENAYKQRGAWVSYRRLNFQHLMYFRQLLKQLPTLGKGAAVVVDPQGKTLVTIKANAQPTPTAYIKLACAEFA